MCLKELKYLFKIRVSLSGMEMNKKQRQCHEAMAKAFNSLREKNLPDDWAAGVGVTIYQFHYPKASKNLAMEKATSLLLKKSNTQGGNDKLKKINSYL